MAVRSGRRWWVVAGLVVVGLAALGLGRFLAGQHLARAEQWSTVIGVFLNIAALAVAVYTLVQARPTPPTRDATVRNTLTKSKVDGSAVLAGDAQQVSLTGTPVPDPAGNPGGSGNVDNRVEDSTIHGSLIMGGNVRGTVQSPESTLGRRGGAGP
jgi:hypothetical protein